MNDILSLDILPRIKELLALNPDHSIKFECAWIITNIAVNIKSSPFSCYFLFTSCTVRRLAQKNKRT